MHKTDLFVSDRCFLALFIFFSMLTLGSEDFLGAAWSEAVARLKSACHLLRRRGGAEVISVSFTGKEL